MRGYLPLEIVSVLLLGLTGCYSFPAIGAYPAPFHSGTFVPGASTAPIVSIEPLPLSAMTGVWQGVSSADCMGFTVENSGRCRATQYITLTMLQQGDVITGSYVCAYGNQVCRNLDETGRIRSGRMIGRRMEIRVMLEDGSMCFFTGIPTHDVMEGRYSCLQGAGIVERGAFRAARAY
jgi:hypothetical protein